MRQYLRCREDFSSGLVHVLLLMAFIVTLVVFARSVGHLFDSQGAHLNLWYKRGALVLMGLFVLSVLRRLYYKVMELRDIRQDMAQLKAVFRDRDRNFDPD